MLIDIVPEKANSTFLIIKFPRDLSKLKKMKKFKTQITKRNYNTFNKKWKTMDEAVGVLNCKTIWSFISSMKKVTETTSNSKPFHTLRIYFFISSIHDLTYNIDYSFFGTKLPNVSTFHQGSDKHLSTLPGKKTSPKLVLYCRKLSSIPNYKLHRKGATYFKLFKNFATQTRVSPNSQVSVQRIYTCYTTNGTSKNNIVSHYRRKTANRLLRILRNLGRTDLNWTSFSLTKHFWCECLIWGSIGLFDLEGSYICTMS